jgi:hypothetical protein
VVGVEHARPGLAPFGDGRGQGRLGRRVQARPRLVQDQQVRVGEQGLDDQDLLGRPLGHGRHARAGPVGEPEAADQVVDPLVAGTPADAGHPGEVAAPGHAQVRRRPLGHVPGRPHPPGHDPA